MGKISIGRGFESTTETMCNYVKEVQDDVEQIFVELYQTAVVEYTWKALYDMAKELEYVYNEKVLETIKSKINQWSESAGSYVGLAARYRVGYEAEAEAERQQSQIVDEITDIPKITSISESQLDFCSTQFEVEVIKIRLEEIYNKAQELNELVEERKYKLEKLSEENSAVSTIVNVGITYGDSIANFVTKVTKEMLRLPCMQIDSVIQQSNIARKKREAEKWNQEIDETCKEMEALMEDLFG